MMRATGAAMARVTASPDGHQMVSPVSPRVFASGSTSTRQGVMSK